MTIYLIPLRKACNCYCRSSEVAPAALPLRVRADCGQSLLQLIQVPRSCSFMLPDQNLDYFIRIQFRSLLPHDYCYYGHGYKEKISEKNFFSLKKIYFTFLCHVTFTFS